MPLGAARLNFLAKSITVAAEAEVIRKKVGVTAINDAQVDTAQSKFGGASALFDGTDDYIVIQSKDNYTIGTGDFTIEMWAYPTSLSGSRIFYDGRDGTVNNNVPVIYYSSQLRYLVSGSTRIFEGGLTLTTNAWQHIAVSRSSGTTKMFIDGTQVGSDYSDSTDYVTHNVVLGIYLGNLGGDYIGNIDEVRLSNTARYTGAFTAPTEPFVNDENTIFLLHMNGTDASTHFEDDNGVGRAAVGIRALNNAQIDTAQSKFGGSSAEFFGNNDYLFSSALIPATNSFTAECWIYFPDTSGDKAIFSQHGDNGAGFVASRFFIASQTLNKVDVYLRNSSNTDWAFRIFGSTAISTNTWTHVAVVRNINTFTLYIDGVNDGSASSSDPILQSDFTIGVLSNSIAYDLNGHIDEVRISDTARYTTGFTPSTTPFVNDSNTLLLLHMDGTDGSTLFLDDNGVSRSRVGVSAVGDAQIDTAQYKFGGSSALFDGTGDYLTLPNITLSGDYTVELWMRPDATTALQSAIRLGHHTGSAWQNGLFIQYRGSAAPSFQNEFQLFTSDGGFVSSSSPAGGTWHHLAISRSGSTTYFFLNGTSIGTASGTTQIGGNASTDNVTIGALVTGVLTQYTDGHIDEVRISNTARYTAAFTPSTTPFQNDANTLLLLHMDGTDGDTDFVDDNGKEST